MPESFSESMGRVHNTKPMMDNRKTDVRNIMKYGGNIGILQGFNVAVTSGVSKNVWVTRGLALSPEGKEVLVAPPASLSAQDYQKALKADRCLVDIQALLGASHYNALDPATHKIMLTLDTETEVLKAHIVSAATASEATDFAAAIAADGEAVDPVAAGTEWDASTSDHAARGRVSMKDPDDLNGAATNVASEFILAFLTKSNALSTGTIASVVVRRETGLWGDFSGLA